MAEGSPKLENLALSNLSSPRFDISDFLRTPRDGSPDDEHKYSLSALNLPLPLPTFDVLSSLPPLFSKADSDHDHDFGSLMFDAKGADDDSAFLSPSLHAEFISFDDIANDSFSVFGESHYDDLVGPSPFSSSAPPCPLAGSNLPSLSFPPHSQFMLPESYVESEPGGQLEVGEYAIPTAENMASTSAGPGSFFTSNQLDWAQEGIGSHHTNIVQQSASQCDSCRLLRCIIHSNGVQETKLEIHGCDGQSYHAVLQTRFCIDDGFPSTFEQQMFEFPVGNAEYVKQFLLQYSLLRRKEGFVLRHDSLQVSSDFGSEINVVSNRVSGGAAGSSFLFYGKGEVQSKMQQSRILDTTDNLETQAMTMKPTKSNAAAQRERTGKLKMSDLAQFFHLPINAAAKELGICPTVLKKICRRNGMRRWPHRKIKSIERIIVTLEQTIADGGGQGDESIRMEIAMLRNEREQLCAGLLGEAKLA